jgi:hypothetical protein
MKMTLLAELEEFVGDHRSHGTRTADASGVTHLPNIAPHAHATVSR